METIENDKERKALRLELEMSVTSTNICLKEVVKEMKPVTLLRNVHPLVRLDFAYRLRDLKMIEPIDVKEFVSPTEPLIRRFGK